MGIVVAALVAAATAVGVGAKEGVFARGHDKTRIETYAFERNVLEMKLARLENTERKVFEIGQSDASTTQTAQLQLKKSRLEEKLTALKAAQERIETGS